MIRLQTFEVLQTSDRRNVVPGSRTSQTADRTKFVALAQSSRNSSCFAGNLIHVSVGDLPRRKMKCPFATKLGCKLKERVSERKIGSIIKSVIPQNFRWIITCYNGVFLAQWEPKFCSTLCPRKRQFILHRFILVNYYSRPVSHHVQVLG